MVTRFGMFGFLFSVASLTLLSPFGAALAAHSWQGKVVQVINEATLDIDKPDGQVERVKLYASRVPPPGQLDRDMQPDKTWIDILTALLTPTLAAFGALIAYLQWRTNELKRKNDYFDRRFSLYKRVEDLWLSSQGSPEMSTIGIRFEYLAQLASEARLLFGDDVAEHICSLSGKSHKGSPFFPDSDFSEPFFKYLRLK